MIASLMQAKVSDRRLRRMDRWVQDTLLPAIAAYRRGESRWSEWFYYSPYVFVSVDGRTAAIVTRNDRVAIAIVQKCGWPAYVTTGKNGSHVLVIRQE